MNAKQIAIMQAEAGIKAAQRSGKSGARLLDDAENNIGNSLVVNPELLPAGMLLTSQKQSLANRLVNLTAESKTGQSVTVVMTAARVQDRVGAVGPLTGVVQFGNGAQTTQVEFDVPVGPYKGNFLAVAAGSQPEDSGAVIQVPTAIVRAFARYDNAYVTPDINGFAYGSPGSAAFPLAVGAGPFAPNFGGHAFAAPVPPSPLLVKAFAAYFGRIHSKLYKTLYLYIGDATVPVAFNAGGSIIWSVPPFAKSVQVICQPTTANMTLTLYDQVATGSNAPNQVLFAETYAIAAGTYPIIKITGNTNAFSLRSTGGGDNVTAVKAIFEVGF